MNIEEKKVCHNCGENILAADYKEHMNSGKPCVGNKKLLYIVEYDPYSSVGCVVGVFDNPRHAEEYKELWWNSRKSSCYKEEDGHMQVTDLILNSFN
jgi:predicted  nucleic acid-binding Zn-ribbon protein